MELKEIVRLIANRKWSLLDINNFNYLKFENNDEFEMAHFIFYEMANDDGDLRVSKDKEIKIKLLFLRKPLPGHNRWYDYLSNYSKMRFANMGIADFYEYSTISQYQDYRSQYKKTLNKIIMFLN